MELKNYIVKKKIKQKELSAKLGVKQQTISSWISGRTVPSIANIPVLAEILDCSIEEIVFALIESRNNKR